MTVDARTAAVILSPQGRVAGVADGPFALPPLSRRIGDPFALEEETPAVLFRRMMTTLAALSVMLAAAGIVAGALVLD